MTLPLLLVAALTVSPPDPPQSETLRIDRQMGSGTLLSIGVGENRLLELSQPIARVSIANPEVADIKVVLPTQLLLTAKGIGSTDLTLWDKRNRPLVIKVAVNNPVDALSRQVQELFPGQEVHVSAMGDLLVLSGQVSDVRMTERIGEVARLHGKKVANLIQVVGHQQVQLEVRFAEVSRTGLREAGLQFFQQNKAGTRVFGATAPNTSPGTFLPSIGQSVPAYPAAQGNAFSFLFSSALGSFPFSATLSLLESNGLAKVLAEPTLTTLTGQEAKFMAGGEIPIPIATGLGEVNVTWKKFGILLAFTPVVLDAQTIQLKLSTEVSELDPNFAVTVAGSTIPGFDSRQGETTVRMGDGQSFAIAGLLSEKTRSTVAQVPVLGSIPILGALFRSSSYQRDETELLIIVTAHLVQPLDASRVPPLPGSTETHPTDFQLFLLGSQNGSPKETPPPPPEGGGPVGPMGFAP